MPGSIGDYLTEVTEVTGASTVAVPVAWLKIKAILKGKRGPVS